MVLISFKLQCLSRTKPGPFSTLYHSCISAIVIDFHVRLLAAISVICEEKWLYLDEGRLGSKPKLTSMRTTELDVQDRARADRNERGQRSRTELSRTARGRSSRTARDGRSRVDTQQTVIGAQRPVSRRTAAGPARTDVGLAAACLRGVRRLLGGPRPARGVQRPVSRTASSGRSSRRTAALVSGRAGRAVFAADGG